MAGGIALWGGLLVALCFLLFVLGAKSGSSELVVRSELNQDIEPLKRSIMTLQRDNALLRGQRAKETDILRAENVALKKTMAELEGQISSLAKRDGRDSNSIQEAIKPKGLLGKRTFHGGVEVGKPPTRDTAPGPTEDSAVSIDFTKERAQRVAVKGCILLTFVNKIRLDFATTWVWHVRRLGMTNWLVGATDKTSLRSLQDSKIPTFDMLTNLPEGEWPWGSPSFKALGPHKIELIYKCLIWDLDMIITDVVRRVGFKLTWAWVAFPRAAPHAQLKLVFGCHILGSTPRGSTSCLTAANSSK